MLQCLKGYLFYNYRWLRDFTHPSRAALGDHPAPCTRRTMSLSRGWSRLGRGVGYPSPSSVDIEYGYSYTCALPLDLYGRL